MAGVWLAGSVEAGTEGEGVLDGAEDFKEISNIGPSRVAAFLGRSEDAGFKADVAGDVRELLQKCGVKTV